MTRDFFTGVSFLLRGLGMYVRSPKLMLLGLGPALLSSVLLFGALVALLYYVDDVSAFLTPYADDWDGSARTLMRVVVGVVIVVAWVVLSVLLYTAVTLLVGQPFYEAISKNVDDHLGGVANEINVSFWRTLPRSLMDSLRIVGFTVLFGVPLFICGFIPVAGEVMASVAGAVVGGWLLALELSSVPFERRGLHFRQRRQALRVRRAMSLGFGVPTFVCFILPPVAVLLMPAAVAGATLLSRRLFGEPDAAGPRRP